FYVSHGDRMSRIGRVPKNRHEVDPRHRFVEELEALGDDLEVDAPGQAGNVPAWACEALDEPQFHRVGGAQTDNGNRPSRVRCLHGRRVGPGGDEVYREPDQLCREGREPVILPLRKAILDGDVLALDPAELA